jgi:hypothetical protein
MKLVEITYRMAQHDENGQDTNELRGRVYLPMCDSVAYAAADGLYDFGLTLALQHISELQGFNFKNIESVVF